MEHVNAISRPPINPDPLESTVPRRRTYRPRRATLRALLLTLTALPLAFVSSSLRAEPPSAEDLDFFENKVRPLLVDHCYACHSQGAEKLRAGLLLDSKAGWEKGGVSGPAIVPGDPNRSLLIQVIHGKATDVDMMPPEKGGTGPLTDAQKSALEEWVSRGAPDPRTGVLIADPVPELARTHWAFQPPARSTPPDLAQRAWVQTGMDKWILASIEAENLTPSPKADRRTLLRRATFDLTGLPPTPEEAAEFEADPDSDTKAFARVVDRLLSSQHFGERWGRHWLDVARYADSKGYVFEEERRYPYSYTYRDWVVRAFNDDMPYDLFLKAQIAGDQLATEEDPSPLAALGFLTLGRRFLNNPHDIIDDRLDVVFRGTQALTVQCARCHDHKYDPIPIDDYYSLYGVFASSEEPGTKPSLGKNPDIQAAAAYTIELDKRENESSTYRANAIADVLQRLRSQVGDYLLCAHETRGQDNSAIETLARERKLDPGLVRTWQAQMDEWSKSPEKHPAFAPWLEFAALAPDNFSTESPLVIERLKAARVQASTASTGSSEAILRENTGESASTPEPDAEVPVLGTSSSVVDRVIEGLLDKGTPPTALTDVAAGYNKLFASIDEQWRTRTAAPRDEGTTAPTSLEDPRDEVLRDILYSDSSPIQEALRRIDRFFDVPTAQRSRALRRAIEELEATHPGSPPRAMALVDRSSPVQPVVFKRGNPGNRGDEVPRQFLKVLSGSNRQPFQKGSGRLELAEAIASPDNPLTARVMVNRVWINCFGSPLVGTPSDFGLRSDPPTHPELLDYLAIFLTENQWSIKTLLREILLSATYQQVSDIGPNSHPDQRAAWARNEATDLGNTRYWRMNRKRLDFEAQRDSLLALSGSLDRTIGGRPVDIHGTDPASRRTLYGFIDRQNLPSILRAFDFASPDTTSAMRFQTTVPQQALYFMNNPFVLERARELAQRVVDSPTDAARIDQLHQLIYQRPATVEDRQLAFTFLVQQEHVRPLPPTAAAWAYGFAAMDPDGNSVTEFVPFSVFKNRQWQPTQEHPAPDGPGYAFISARGGHPGRDMNHAVARRWTAPITGHVKITGTLHHPGEPGDGVRARLIHNAKGSLATWTAHNARTATEVQSVEVEVGDTLDFIVDMQTGDNTDSFEWSPIVTLTEPGSGSLGKAGLTWNASEDFVGPTRFPEPLDTWGKYAQVLLSSNEAVFID